MRIVALTCARMGSTRLPGKCMLPLNGKPLIQYTFDLAKMLGIQLYIWTRDEELMDYASNKVPIIYEPIDMYDTPTNTTLAKIKRVFDLLYPDYIVLLQPTHPLRDHEVIRSWIDSSIECEVAYAQSVMHVSDSDTVVDSGSFFLYTEEYAATGRADKVLELIETPPFDIHTQKDLDACEVFLKRGVQK